MWIFYALLSALFASLTALFAKIGVKDVNPNLATAIRTVGRNQSDHKAESYFSYTFRYNDRSFVAVLF